MKAFDANHQPPAAIDASGPGAAAGADERAVFALLPPHPLEATGEHAPARRDRRDRVLIAAAGALACLALATSLVALNRDVPFLDVSVARAAAQGETTSDLAVTVPDRPTTTTTAEPQPATTVAEPAPTSVPELLPAAELPAVQHGTVEEEEGAADAAGDGGDDSGNGGDDGGDAWATDAGWPATTAAPVSDTIWLPPAPTPTEPAGPADSPGTTAAPTPTTAAPTTTVPAGPVLHVAMSCPHDTAGLSLALATDGDATLKKVLVRTFGNECRRAKVLVAVRDAGGSVLAELPGRVRGSAPYNLEVTGWPAVPASQVASVTLSDG